MADDVLLNKAAIIGRCLRRVEEEYRSGEKDIDRDYTRQDSIVLNLQRACEAAIDLAMHVVRVRKLGLPQESREAFTLLHQAGLIDETVTRRMQAMVGFRNVAVHAYQKLSIPVVKAIAGQRLGDFQAFIAAMMRVEAGG